MTKNSWNACT